MYKAITFQVYDREKASYEKTVDAPIVKRAGTTALDPIIRIGRDGTADLCLEDKSIATEQAEIFLTSDGPYILDLSLADWKATRLNREKASEPIMFDLGDTITLGQSRLIVKELLVYGDEDEKRRSAKDLKQQKKLELKAARRVSQFLEVKDFYKRAKTISGLMSFGWPLTVLSAVIWIHISLESILSIPTPLSIFSLGALGFAYFWLVLIALCIDFSAYGLANESRTEKDRDRFRASDIPIPCDRNDQTTGGVTVKNLFKFIFLISIPVVGIHFLLKVNKQLNRQKYEKQIQRSSVVTAMRIILAVVSLTGTTLIPWILL
ncbi:MAG: FHA domain-containing protein [Deltaproteobacteria bacterium]|nr:FHA domain-containing protein [Deltaproteobacteria bacterium]